MRSVEIFPIEGLPVVKRGDDLAELICKQAECQGIRLEEKDILVVTHVVVSRAEGRIIDLDTIIPSEFAKQIASDSGKDASLVEIVLRESRSIVRMREGHIITETRHGFICANAGVDKSNVPGERNVAPLPERPDVSARLIQQRIRDITGKDVAVIISDTHGRALRNGEINVAIGVSGLNPIRDRRGEKDLFDYTLKVKQTAIADELSSAAELVIGQASEGVPVALIRGYTYEKAKRATSQDLIRPRNKCLFL